MHTESHTQSIHIFVTRGNEHIKVEFDSDVATGLDIKRRVGGSELDGLYHRVHGDVVEVADDEVVELTNGMQFTLVPNGRVS